jgi:hypothetical protein
MSERATPKCNVVTRSSTAASDSQSHTIIDLTEEDEEGLGIDDAGLAKNVSEQIDQDMFKTTSSPAPPREYVTKETQTDPVDVRPNSNDRRNVSPVMKKIASFLW